MKILQFDSVGGASGDMILGALIDLGVPVEKIQAAISGLGVEDIHLHADKVVVDGIHGTRAEVHCHDGHGHDHDDGHEHHHGHEHEEGHVHHHGHEHDHGHPPHAHEPHDHGHGHPPHAEHRNLHDIEHLIRESALSRGVQEMAVRVFERLGEAEALVHGTTIDQIHFHEVGALDSIADIIGSCVALELLDVGAVTFGPLPQGRGTIRCEHGVYPNPPPATLQLLRGLPVEQTEEPFELVTPTGAALLSTWRSADRAPTGSKPVKIGYGFGQRKLAQRTNCLRAVLLEAGPADDGSDSVLVLETNLDDTTPEIIGALCERLMGEGALDVFTTPVFMKKQRPATLLSVLCAAPAREKMLELIFRESTTFGIREYEARRTILQRELVTVQTAYGDIRVKIGRRGGTTCARSPEMDDCVAAARRHGVPVREVYLAASSALK